MGYNVYFGNLPEWVTADDIRSWLTSSDLVADAIRVIRDFETQESKGYAFVEAPNEEEMHAIIRRFNRAPIEQSSAEDLGRALADEGEDRRFVASDFHIEGAWVVGVGRKLGVAAGRRLTEVGQAETVGRHRPVLRRRQLPGRQSGLEQRRPETVLRMGVVGGASRRDVAGGAAAEHHAQPLRQHIRQDMAGRGRGLE